MVLQVQWKHKQELLYPGLVFDFSSCGSFLEALGQKKAIHYLDDDNKLSHYLDSACTFNKTSQVNGSDAAVVLLTSPLLRRGRS